MKSVVNAKQFKSALSVVKGAIASKNPMAVFNNVLISVADGKMTLRGGGNDLSISRTIETAYGEDDRYLANAGELAYIFSTIPDVPVELDREGGMLTIRFDLAEFEMPTGDAKEYPVMPASGENEYVEIAAKDIRLMSQSVAYAVSTEPIRPMMQGVLFDVKPDYITFVASDTHKLAALTIPGDYGKEFKVIVPKLFAERMVSLLPDDEEAKIAFFSDGHKISVRTADGTLDGVAVRGNYPDYNRVMPDYTQGHVICRAEKQDLLCSLNRAGTAKGRTSGLVKLDLNANGSSFVGIDADYARKAVSKLTCEYDGPEMAIGVNCDYMKEIIKYSPTPTVEIYVSNATRPLVALPIWLHEGALLRTLLMPLQLIES